MLRMSLEERDHDAAASKSVVFYNFMENNDDNEAVSDLMTTLKIPQSYVKRSTRLGRKSAAIPPPRPCPIEVLLDCEHDKGLLMANVYLLEISQSFVKPKLKWSDRQKEKSSLKLRYTLIQHGFDRKLFRIRELKLFYYGVEIKDRDAFETIATNLRTISIATRGVNTIAKQSKLLDFVNVHNLDILLITETWWTDNMSCSLFGMFNSIGRSDRQKGPRGGVAIRSRLTCKIFAEEINSDDFDFAAAAAIQLPGDSVLLIILVYLPYPSPYEVSFDVMERLFDSI